MNLIIILIIQQSIHVPESAPINLCNHNRIVQNALLPTDCRLSYRVSDDRVYATYNGKVIGAILPRSQFRTFSFSDSVQTIWLPDTLGGVVKPDVFACNPIHEVMYVMGREQQNISICDRQTGERVGGILTNNGTIAMAYSETSDKLYCASFASNTIEVIDGEKVAGLGIRQNLR